MTKRLLVLALTFYATIGLIAQTTISGIIKDAESGDPLIGANIIIEGTTIGASTDLEGAFSITSAESLPWTVEVSYTGFSTQTIQVTQSQSNLMIALESNAAIMLLMEIH